ncbi:hypothetical protein RR46_09866 [Papilio xuthus]|uniref:Uncharacterized protein n=1 Tax=Papilio xuthus TaxID=66420 RepID=A0A194QAU9_PAPXU|nr:hypothetical protein RR46_09866 [Papilio xuthus]
MPVYYGGFVGGPQGGGYCLYATTCNPSMPGCGPCCQNSYNVKMKVSCRGAGTAALTDLRNSFCSNSDLLYNE